MGPIIVLQLYFAAQGIIESILVTVVSLYYALIFQLFKVNHDKMLCGNSVILVE